MMDSRGNIIYVGKSICLRKRVKSYFTSNHKWSKVEKLVFFTDDIYYVVTDTHLEARLLECELIKKFKPIFNSQMKNEREYVYLKVEGNNKYKALSIVPEREKCAFGPFRNKHRLSNIIDSLQFIYPILKTNDGYDFDLHVLPVSMNHERKRHYYTLTDENINHFLSTACSRKKSTLTDQDEKSCLDFHDILYSEIISLPTEMVVTI